MQLFCFCTNLEKMLQAQIIYMDDGLLNELKLLVHSYPKNYVKLIQSRGLRGKSSDRSSLREYIYKMTGQLVDTRVFRYAWKTRVYWTLNSILDWNDNRVKCVVCGSPFYNRDVRNIVQGYANKTCSRACGRALAQKSCIQHMQQMYGVDNAFQIKHVVERLKESKDIIQQHRDATKALHKTFSSSRQEDTAYEMLCEKLGNSNVIRQYKSSLYPFSCDFYIPCLDLYIECNFSWTHGGHWFDSSSRDDIITAQSWKSKGTPFYLNALQTWTRRDVEKRMCAKKNKLRYLVFWSLQAMRTAFYGDLQLANAL